jgi:preprotein translocase subunit SecE
MPKSKNRRKSKRPSTGTQPATAAATAGGAESASESSSASARTVSGEASEKVKRQKVGPVQFLRQVRDEARKITWTSRNETLVSTIMVLIMVALASVFFFGVDQVLRFVMARILELNA